MDQPPPHQPTECWSKVPGSWTDPEPLKTGRDFSIGTCMTKASFKDIAVRPLP